MTNHQVILCEANELQSMTNIENFWFHTIDPFSNVVFLENQFYVDKTTDMIIVNVDKSRNFYVVFENGHVATTDTTPTNAYVYVALTFFDTHGDTLMVNWAVTSTHENTPSFTHNRLPFDYGMFGLMYYEANLLYDIGSEVSADVLNNEFTVIVKCVVQQIELIRLFLLSDEPLAFHPTTDGDCMIKLFVVPASSTSWTVSQYMNNEFIRSTVVQKQHSTINIRCTRTRQDQHITVENVMVFTGSIVDDTKLNRIGEQNICIGYKAGYSTDHGSDNIFMGKESGKQNVYGQQNVALGLRALQSAQHGINNICIGTDSGASNDDGHTNICIGKEAGMQNQKGTSNVFVGNQAGRTNQGDSNVIIGHADHQGSESIVIGNHNVTTGDGQLWIGNILSGDMFLDRITVHGNLHVSGSLHYDQINVRMKIVTSYTSTEMFEYVTLHTTTERIDILQRIEEDTVPDFDFKISPKETPVVVWKNKEDEEDKEERIEVYLPFESFEKRISFQLNLHDNTVSVN